MSRQQSAVVSGNESDVHDEPHLRGSRITVRYLHAQVEERGLRPETVAEEHGLSLAAVYHALAYYHDNPEEMSTVEGARERAMTDADRRTTIEPPSE